MSAGAMSTAAPSAAAQRELISKFEKSFVFGPYFQECMETDRTLRGNCWSHQVLIENANHLLDKYVRNPTQSTLDKFFRFYVTEKYPKKISANNFVMAFFLSIEHFAPICFEIEAIQTLFTRDFPKGVIEDWWHIRDCCMLIHNLTGNLTTPLNTFFLSKSEYIVLIERVRNSERIKKDIEVWVGAREQEIKELRKYVRQHKNQFKQKLDKFEKHFKIGKTSASPICLQLLGYYVEDFEEEQAARAKNPVVKKRDDGREIHSDDVIVVDDDLNVVHKTKIGDSGKEKPGHRLELAQQKTALVDEIQQLTRESNTKREVVLKLVGLLKAMDPVFLEAREKIEIARRKLLGLKRGITDDEAKRMIFMEIGLEGLNFFDDGTKVNKDTHNSLLNNLKTENLQFSRDVGHRCQGYATEMARYRDMLREKIFADKDLFRQVHVGKKDKHEQEFHTMNKGIDPDRLNQSDYITRKQDGDLPDYEVELDDAVDQVLGPLDGAKQTWEEMLRNTRGWEKNPYSKDDIDRRRSRNNGWDRYQDDDDDGGDPDYQSPNKNKGGFDGSNRGSPNQGGDGWNGAGGRDQRTGFGDSPNNQNSFGSPSGAADEPYRRDPREGNFDSFGGGNRGNDYDSFGPNSQNGRRDPRYDNQQGGDPYSNNRGDDRYGNNDPRGKNAGNYGSRDGRTRPINPYFSENDRNNTYDDQETADFKDGGSNRGGPDGRGGNNPRNFGSGSGKDGNTRQNDYNQGRGSPGDQNDPNYDRYGRGDGRTGTNDPYSRDRHANGPQYNSRDGANNRNSGAGRIDPSRRQNYDPSYDDPENYGRNQNGQKFDPRGSNQDGLNGNMAGNGSRMNDPRFGNDPRYRDDPRYGNGSRDNRDPRYANDPTYDPRSGRDPRYGEDPRNSPGYRESNDPRYANDPRYQGDSRNGNVANKYSGRDPQTGLPQDQNRPGSRNAGDRNSPAGPGYDSNNTGRNSPVRRDRYGNPVAPMQADTKSIPKGTRGYVSPGGGNENDPMNNRGDKTTFPGENQQPGGSGSNSRPVTPGKSGGDASYSGSPARAGDYNPKRGYQDSPGAGYNGSPKRPVDPNDPLSIAGLDYGKGLPKTGGSGTKGTAGTGISNNKPAEVHKATSGTGKGGAVRRNVLPGEANKDQSGANAGKGPVAGPNAGGNSRDVAPIGTPDTAGAGPTNPGGSSGGSNAGKPGGADNIPKDGDDDIVIADDGDIHEPDHKELLPMDFDDEDEDQPGTGAGSSRPTNPANKMSAGTGTVKPGARKVVPGSGGSGTGMNQGDGSDSGNQIKKTPQAYDQDPIGGSNNNPNPGAPRSGDDFDPSTPGQLKPAGAPDGVSGDTPGVDPSAQNPAKPNQGSGGPPPPPAANPNDLKSGNTLDPSDPSKKRTPGTDKRGSTLTIDPPDASKARRKSVRPDGQNLPPTPPADQEKLTTLEDLVNASDTVEFEDKLGKYTQSKGAA